MKLREAKKILKEWTCACWWTNRITGLSCDDDEAIISEAEYLRDTRLDYDEKATLSEAIHIYRKARGKI